MYTLYKFHFLNGISKINQLFDDILIIWPAPVYTHTPLQKYWNSEANSFIFAVDWKHLGLTSKDEYEMRD